MNIYVSNLGYDVTDDGLQQLFSSFGEVSSAKVIKDKFTNSSRGFGFVEMPDDSAAANAIDSLNNSDFNGKTLRVSEARPREERPNNNRGGGGGYNNYRSDNRGGGDYKKKNY